MNKFAGEEPRSVTGDAGESLQNSTEERSQSNFRSDEPPASPVNMPPWVYGFEPSPEPPKKPAWIWVILGALTVAGAILWTLRK